MNIFDDLKERGFIYQCTDEENTSLMLEREKLAFYAGFDPTADSLHVGHLLPIMAMKRLQEAGHRPIVLVGGATALVGDPSGKQEARPILSKEDVAANADSLKGQLSRFISFDNAVFVNNADWFLDLRYIDFLREVGCRFSVNKMLTAESVRQRLETGLSFLEFNYMLLQAYDFYVLNRDHGCRLQIGGQDQWGNIVAGIDLVRKMSRQESFGFTIPLLTDSSGQKFGKTAAGAVWLDPARTSVFDYYQFWRNCDDADVKRLLYFYTSLPSAEVERLGSLEPPLINRAKEILAFEATKLAHGPAEAAQSYTAACGKFGFADPGGSIETTSSIRSLGQDASAGELPSYETEVPDDGIWIVKLFTDSGLLASNGEARRLIKGGGAYMNDKRIGSADIQVMKSDFSDGELILKAGKKNVRRILLKS